MNRVFEDYLAYGNLTHQSIAGKRVLEFGPGDNLGVALRFLAFGAREYVCIDKFYCRRDSGRERLLYQALREVLSEQEKRNFDLTVNLKQGIALNPQKLRCIYGTGAEEADTVLPANSFDLIISRAVLEEVDTDRCFRAMDRLLLPGGVMLHKVDLGDYGMFSAGGFHPLEFLTISSFVYGMMTWGGGRPNRRHIDYYRRALQDYGMDGTTYCTGIVTRIEEIVPHKLEFELGVDYTDADIAMIDEIRPRLQEEYRSLSDADLLTSGIFIVARKPE